jgi:glycosyltransferase involved in cell wall biosynthesis
MINIDNKSLFVDFRNITRVTTKLIKDIIRLVNSEGVGAAVKAAANAAEGNFYKWFKEARQVEFIRIKDPLEVIYLPVEIINKRISAGATRKYKYKYGYEFHPEYRGTKRINPDNQGVVLGGDWDRYSEKLKISSTTIAFWQRFKNNRRWKDTAYYDCFLKSIYVSRKKVVKGAKNWDEFRQRWLVDKEKLYWDIKNNGYKRQVQIKGGRVENEVEVGVSRQGEVLLIDGIHRLSIAKMLGIKEIPVIVKVWHKNYIDKTIRKTGLDLEEITPSVVIGSVLEKARVSLKREKIKKISVVVPVFNEDQIIERCVRSLLEQDLDKNLYEVIIVNDGSTDRTSRVLERFGSEINLRVITLTQNRGRIIARKVGVEAAEYGYILLFDSRRIAGKNLLSKLLEIQYQPIMVRSIIGEDKKAKDPFNKVIDIFREKYYLKESFNKPHWVNEKNFKRSSKGAGCLFISKTLFFKCLPEETGSHINDDTRILREVVKHKLILKCTPGLSHKYIAREKLKNILSHIFFRGPRFADYYLSEGGPYYNIFVLFLFILLFSLIFVIFYPFIFYFYFIFILLFHIGLSAFLAKTFKDFFLVLIFLPIIFVFFASGVIFGKVKKIITFKK